MGEVSRAWLGVCVCELGWFCSHCRIAGLHMAPAWYPVPWRGLLDSFGASAEHSRVGGVAKSVLLLWVTPSIKAEKGCPQVAGHVLFMVTGSSSQGCTVRPLSLPGVNCGPLAVAKQRGRAAAGSGMRREITFTWLRRVGSLVPSQGRTFELHLDSFLSNPYGKGTSILKPFPYFIHTTTTHTHPKRHTDPRT